MLNLQNISFSYSPQTKILKGISLAIPQGEMLAICGRNGSGKTTLTRLMMGLDKPETGSISYEGQDITEKSASERGHFIGYVFQRPDRQMFRNTVMEEVSFGPEQLGYTPEEVKKITTDVMEKVGITHVANEYPLNLRRGLKQRIAIASALAMQSKIIILDEPTSGQDGKETIELLKILNTLHKEGITIIIVTHDMDIVSEYCERVIVLHQGDLAFDNTPEALFTACDHIFEYGLAKPISVELSETISELGYCPTMEIFEQRLIKLQGGE